MRISLGRGANECDARSNMKETYGEPYPTEEAGALKKCEEHASPAESSALDEEANLLVLAASYKTIRARAREMNVRSINTPYCPGFSIAYRAARVCTWRTLP